MNYCKDCKFWLGDGDGVGTCGKAGGAAEFYVHCPSQYGIAGVNLFAELKTRNTFGCNKYEQRIEVQK